MNATPGVKEAKGLRDLNLPPHRQLISLKGNNSHHTVGKKTSNSLPAAAAKSLQSYPTLCDYTDGRPPGSTVPWILQARTMEWVAISFSNHESEK